MKVTTEFVWNQQTSDSKLISVGIPTLTVFRPKLSVEYCVRPPRKNDEKAHQNNQQMKDRTARKC